MTRLLLTVALLLRLAPAPGMAASHCAPEGPIASAVPGADHQHHGAPASGEQSSSEECTHCPPSDCAEHRSCEVPSVVSWVESMRSGAVGAPTCAAAHAPLDAWATNHTAPPTRPPASPLV